jgi:GNAT superfamily N-acetyltransferase
MLIVEAQESDLQPILDLQYLAYQSEAQLLNNDSIPPLQQTLGEVKQEYRRGIFLKAVDEDGHMVGSVRGYAEGDTVYVGKLMVHPDYQGQGIGTQLLSALEARWPQFRFELFTSDRSLKNIGLYERAGYVRFKEQDIAPGLRFVYFEKCGNNSGPTGD